ncbi:MAG: hypothetical protein ISS27_02435 [Candidatus Omnitrophica bacterium]|nr:hypothetical protein [Candidatus Omnitrophota bacterium]
MEDRDKYFLVEASLTFIMLLLVLSLFSSSLDALRLLTSGVILAGFLFSWTIRSQTLSWTKYLVSIACLGIFIWMVYSFIGSSLLYEEVVLISIKGLFFLVAALSFYVCDYNYLAYVQALSIPLFLCAPLTIKAYDSLLVIIALGGYLFIWPVIIKMKFYRSFQREFTWDYKVNYAFTAVLVILLISLLSGGIFLVTVPLRKVPKEGIFSYSLHDKDLDSGMSVLLREYYRLQDELLSTVPEAIPFRETPENKFALLGLLDYLIKDSSTIQEVDRANQGLVSYFKTPGPGIEPGKGEKVEILMKDYVKVKSEVNMEQKKEEVSGLLQDPLLLRERFKLGRGLDKIQKSKSVEEISEIYKELKEYVEASSLAPEIKAKILELISELMQWKFFQMGILDPLTGLNPEAIKRILEGPAPELIEPVPEEEPAAGQIPPLAKSKGFAVWGAGIIKFLFNFSLLATLLVLIIASILYFVFYSIIGRKKRELLELYRNNPRAFIIDIYEHLKEVLGIIGFRCPKHMTPLVYAEVVERKCSIGESLYLRFTEKFEEVKYSRHEVGGKDADLFFNQYNSLLKILAGKYSKFTWFSKYLLILAQKKPFFITKG